MDVFAITAIALAIFAVGLVLVAAVVIYRIVTQLRSALNGVAARLAPLTEEFQAEAAVAAAEVERLQARFASLRSGDSVEPGSDGGNSASDPQQP